MDTTPPPPPPPPPLPVASSGAATRRLFRLRLLGADVVDLALAAGTGTAAGMGFHALVAVDDPTGFAPLATFFLAALLGCAVAFVVAIVALVMTARGGSPGDRLVLRRHDGGSNEVGWRTARWFALPLVLMAAAAVMGTASEPGLVSQLGPPVAGLLALGMLALAYVDTADDRWLRAVAVAAGTGLALGVVVSLVVPQRDLFGSELRAAATAAAPEALRELGATRVCSAPGVADVPAASHLTEPCADPDAVWAVPGSAEVVAGRVARSLAAAVPAEDGIRVTDERQTPSVGAFELRVGSAWTVAWVADTPCGTRVLVATGGAYPSLDGTDFVPDRDLAGRCA